MSATILDELVVSIGLDVHQLLQSQKEALSRLDELEKKALTTAKVVSQADKDQAKVEKDAAAQASKIAKEQAANNKNQVSGLEIAKRAVFALTTAYLGFNAIKTATVEITKSDVALDRFAKGIDTPINKIKALESAVQDFGGSQEDVDSALLNSANVIAKMHNGMMPSADFNLGMGRLHIEPGLYLNAANELDRFRIVQDAVNASVKAGMTQNEAIDYAGRMGYNRTLVSIMLQQNKELDASIAKYEKLNQLSKLDTMAAESRTAAWNTFTNAI